MQKGSPPNYIRGPDPVDISRDGLEFNAWWSPGQYVVPVLFTFLGASLGTGMLFTIVIFSVLGTIGYLRVFKQLGFLDTALLACALIVSSSSFAVSFGMYTGGEVLLFGGCPWILSFCLRRREIGSGQFLQLVLVFLAGSFLKISFSIYALGIVSALIIARIATLGYANYRGLFSYSVKAAGVFAAFYGILYLGYLSWGRNPSLPQAQGLHLSVLGVLAPLSLGPLDALLIGDVVQSSGLPINVLRLIHLLGAVSLCVFLRLIWKSRSITLIYKSLTLGMSIAYVVAFGYLYLKQAWVSQEARHFVPLGLILIPGLVQIWREASSRLIGYILPIIVLGGCVGGVHTFLSLTQDKAISSNIGSLGFTQTGLSRGALSVLHFLDEKLSDGNNVFYVPSPEIALEITKNRAINAHLKAPDGRYHGRVDNLFVLIREEGPDARDAANVLALFPDYAALGWQRIQLKSSSFYFQGEVDASLVEEWVNDSGKRMLRTK